MNEFLWIACSLFINKGDSLLGKTESHTSGRILAGGPSLFKSRLARPIFCLW